MRTKKVSGASCGDSPKRAAHKSLPAPWPASILPVVWMGLVLAGAAALRLADLGNRPMHCDEAVHAVKLGRLLEEDDYVYNPREYHGPSLNFLTLPIAWAASATKLAEITEIDLRLLPAIFGIVLVAMVWLVRDELGEIAAVCAAALAAVSPAMVFYSRYYIQEMLLVTFTFGAMVALWRYARVVGELKGEQDRPGRGAWFWPVLLGLSVGMMHATKETCVIALVAMTVAAALAMGDLRRAGARRLVLAGLVVAVTAVSVSALFFSSFLDNPRGVVDSYTTYFYYLGRASGEGSVGRHVYPPDYYLRVLFWWHRGAGPPWTEASIAALGLLGLAAAVSGRGLKPAHLPMARFLSIYAVLMTAIYSAMPYKTPWCGLGFLHGLILLAGVGVAVLVRAAEKGDRHLFRSGASRCRELSAAEKCTCPLFLAAIAVLIAAAGHLAWEAHRASFVACDDPNSPYVYAHTTRDVPRLAERVEQIAAAHPDGRAMHVQVICPDDDYWPLPWYLRSFNHVGWFGRMPHGPPAPLIITQPAMEPALLKYLYEDQPPGQRNLYVPVPQEPAQEDWQLRPHVPLRVYARLDLWDAYRAGQ